MATATKVQVIDADAHVLESERTWDYLDASEQRFRPKLYRSADDPANEYWVIDGKIRGFRFASLSEQELRRLSERSGRNVVTPKESREMDDVSLRLRGMDDLGIDVQVLHNTLWIEQVTNRVDIDVAICGAWNRWMAGVWKQGEGRLLWTAVLPLLSISDAIDQMAFAQEHGAVGVCMRPLEGGRIIADPYFHPIYEEAERRNLPIAIHIANANPAVCDALRSPWDPGSNFVLFRGPTVMACHTLLVSNLHALFPKLRWGFIEASAQWVPWILREAKSRFSSRQATGAFEDAPTHELLARRNVYVTCQTNDDVPYLIAEAGDDNFVIGTDYGHFDPSSELDAISVFKERFADTISPDAMRKILCDNAKALYGIP